MSVMTPIFAACQRFDSQRGDAWTRYVEWSGYAHLSEVVSMDTILCPSLIDALIGADWNFNVHADNRVHYFRDYEYLKRRIAYDGARHNLLALIEAPDRQLSGSDLWPSTFSFCGYDILDVDNSISLLLNCGAFPSIFGPEDVNRFGLLDHFARAVEIAHSLRQLFPDDFHCNDCRIWAIARHTNAT
ncbi:hypothetical protein [Nodosilinea sp. FACHB-13]|uniref:hypothetical protein n=1 Tax=Cyanophyceae TaxID=3028117 RepID=UPI00168776D5|nr:hypothetical protein [Nodosilinea sp. FACHB-13]MBD2109502.1 hypothetical protein [Nodosilinea sp. FACHB-13]